MKLLAVRPSAAGLAVAAAALAVGLAIGLLPLQTLVVAAGLLAAGAVVVAVLAAPTLGLALTLIAGPLEPLEQIRLALPVDSGQALFALTLGAYALRWLSGARPSAAGVKSALRFAAPALVFLAAGVVTFFPAADFRLWLKECVKWAEVAVVIALVAVEARAPGRRRLIVAAILFVAAAEALFGIYQFAFRQAGPAEFALPGGRLFRASGTLEQPNPYGGYMGLSWPFALGLAAAWLDAPLRLALRRDWKGVWAARRTLTAGGAALVVAVLCLGGLIASWSRGAWIGAAAAAAVFVIALSGRPLPALAAALGGGAFVAGLWTLGILPPALVARLTEFTTQFDFSNIDVRGAYLTAANFSLIERLAHWQAAVGMIIDHPWLGVGFGNYPAAYDAYRTLRWVNPLGHAHNIYLNVFAETGIIGLLSYLGMWGFYGVAALRAARPAGSALTRGVAAGALAMIAHLTAHHLFDNLYVANTFLLIGASLGLFGAAREPHA